MSLVVADTTPINYLALCGTIDVLRPIYGQVVIPSAVFAELNHQRTPSGVRAWVNALPEWVSVKTPVRPLTHPSLGLGEREAIALAKELNAVEVLIDERLARDVAIQSGVAVTGTVAGFGVALRLRDRPISAKTSPATVRIRLGRGQEGVR